MGRLLSLAAGLFLAVWGAATMGSAADKVEEGLGFDLKAASVTGALVTKQDASGLTMEGIDKNWGEVILPDNGVADLEIRGILQIVKPGAWYDWDRPGYFPLRNHYTTEEPGYDFGIVLRYQNQGVFYRILFSTKWNEVALWKEGEPGVDPEKPPIPSGLYAAVRSHTITRGQDYAFSVKVAGPRLQIALDGRTVLDYTDPVLPLEQGGWGLGIFNGARVRVSNLTLSKAGVESASAARKQTHFKAVRWHGDDVIFDGDEPVARLKAGTALWMVDAKLRPGYRALTSWPHLFENIHRASRLVKIQSLDESTLQYSFGLSHENVVGRGTMTLTYDPRRDSYCYTVDKSVTFQRPTKEYWYYGGIYFANTFYYNSMPTTDESLPRDWAFMYTASSPYRMALVQGANGTPYRLPIQHFYSLWQKEAYGPMVNNAHWFDEANGLAKNMYFVRYPAPVVCPAVEIVSAGRDGGASEVPMLTPCCCYWDMHFSYIPHKNGQVVTELNPGDTYRDQFRIIGYPRAEADRLLQKSKLAPFLKDDLECPWYVPGVNNFAKGGNVEATAGREIWVCRNGVTWDRTVGRGDTFSLRFENDACVNDDLIGYNDDGVGCKKWEMTAWVKAEQWEGPGIRLGIRDFSARPRWDVSEYTPIRTGQWQKVSYSGPHPVPSTGHPYLEDVLLYPVIQTKGKGVCWVDDVEFKKLEK